MKNYFQKKVKLIFELLSRLLWFVGGGGGGGVGDGVGDGGGGGVGVGGYYFYTG